MKKYEIIRLGVILFIITAIAGLILGGANEITKASIEKQTITENNNAMRETLPKAESFKKLNISADNKIVKEVNEGFIGTSLVGYTIKVVPKGYNGNLEIVVGISLAGKVEGIKIIAQNETPGLGANSVKPSFSGQFKGKALTPKLQVVKTPASKPNEIDAITGATITSKAVTLGVNEAINVFTTQLKGGQK
jgi:Na+-translocating ferredoxin:NAD+ oxidoreductase subunit G